MDTVLLGRTSGARLVGMLLRATGAAGPRETGCIADGLAEVAGGVIRLMVGRETTAADGRAVALGPSMAWRDGEMSGLPMAEMFRKAPGEIRAAF
jgi:hypothetical protein